MPPLTDLDSSGSATTRPWHVLSQETVFSELGVAATGPDTAEASQRMERYGPNRLPEAPPRSLLMRLLAQFHNLLICVLLGAVLIAGAMGHWVDTIVILGVVLAMIGLTAPGETGDAASLGRERRMRNESMQDSRDSAVTGTSSVNSHREE